MTRKTVLVFHHNDEILSLWSQFLGKYAEVFTTSNPRDAVSLYKSVRPEIVVADYCQQMDDRGYVFREIREFEDLIQRKSVVFATSEDPDIWNEPKADYCFRTLPQTFEKLGQAVLLECGKPKSN